MLFFFFNIGLLVHTGSRYHVSQFIPGPVSVDIYPVYHIHPPFHLSFLFDPLAKLGLECVAIVMAILVYSIFQHYYDMHIINKSEKRYKSFFEENFAGIAVVDKTGKIIEVNDAFAKMFNIQVQNLSIIQQQYQIVLMINFSTSRARLRLIPKPIEVMGSTATLHHSIQISH